MESIVSPTANNVFWMYLSFQPCKQETYGGQPTLVIQNANVNQYRIGTLAEQDDWASVYAKTKLNRVVVSYYPAITNGMASEAVALAQSAVIHTIPIYDNVDDIVSEGGAALLSYTQSELQDVLRKPYARTHNIYKPWKRVLVPKQFMKQSGYGGATNFYKKASFNDLSNTEVTLHGLLVGMPPVFAAGFNVSGDPLPLIGEDITLGRIMLSFNQSFKTRT